MLVFLVSHFPLADETGLVSLIYADAVQAIQKILNKKQYSLTCVKYSPSKRLKIGKFAGENGTTDAMLSVNFKMKFQY